MKLKEFFDKILATARAKVWKNCTVKDGIIVTKCKSFDDVGTITLDEPAKR